MAFMSSTHRPTVNANGATNLCRSPWKMSFTWLSTKLKHSSTNACRRDGALSAALGGAINIVAGWVYGWRVSAREAHTAGETLALLFRAWGIKVLLIIAGLVMVLSLYKDIVHVAFFITFALTVGLFAAAIAVGETK